MKILYLAPHLSTGGMPAFLLKRVELMLDYTDAEIHVVEYQNYSDEYVVQKNQLKDLDILYHTLGDDKTEVIDIIKRNNIDVVHIDEMAESLGCPELLALLYDNSRTWRVVETCHNISFNPDTDKMYQPDAYAFCTPHHLKTFENMLSKKRVLEFPIDNNRVELTESLRAKYQLGFDIGRKHVVNVGLWTPGKNQKEMVELARKMPMIEFHFVGNQAGNFEDYWKPIMKKLPKNVTVWGERKDVHVFMKAADVFMFNSTWECNPLVLREAIGYGKRILARNLPQYEGMFDEYIMPISDDLKGQLEELLDCNITYEIPTGQSETFADNHYHLYEDLCNKEVIPQAVTIFQNFVNGPFLEIKGGSNSLFNVKFFDGKECIYENNINSNCWVRLNRKWFTKWRAEVRENGKLIYENTLDLTEKRVYIGFDTQSLGDTIAWMEYARVFKRKHDCVMLVSTFHNNLFEESYPEIQFIKPGETVYNIYAQYNLGWFYNPDMEPILPNIINLQEAATNILGLEFQEIRPVISYTPGNNKHGKYVTIATNSTSGCKFWTREGWADLAKALGEKGYKVINVSLEPNVIEGIEQIVNKDIVKTMQLIHHSEFFIGLGSGVSWLAWALNKEVVMINNFTKPDHEFTCHRVINTNVCNGCWNNPNFKFDKGDWDWCPIHKGTDRHFECQKSISADMVLDVIKKAGF